MNKVQKVLLVLVALLFAIVLFGCTDWEKRYKALNVEHENLKGLYDNCMGTLDSSSSDKAQMNAELAACQETAAQLRSELEQLRASGGGQTTGFEGMDVSYDAAAGTITVTLPNAILFSPGKADLKKSTVGELDAILRVLRERYSGRGVDVVGHTDSDPIRKSKWKDNWQLSAERALSVLRYLETRGIADDNLRAVAAGSARPIASNSTSAGKARNRRVEIVVNMR